ncbi:histidine phosphatase family protein [Nakamurella flavida]|uniref:Histidine phosphatase family protein n=1 Tax=Nakamurella flavida TaxID=363630 RepID=A0A938YKL3_9ACTN|nr:histidine phosphatase family protein [Nakamurella flavida]MBM9476418.1 histidine phosphatase family protein [Nakamurella flavida]MDP9779481.1 phosphohistidine phosphatase [Nakamurella flavida]
MTADRTLVLLRHGKSGYPPGVDDHDRPLAARGRREAALAGAWIDEQVPPLDAVLCSTALRTRQTLEHTGLGAPAEFRGEIYEAAPGDLRELVAALDPDLRSVLLVGHAPGIPALALALAGPGSDADAVAGVDGHFPTSAIAVLRIAGPWSDLTGHGPATGARLAAFHIARD